MDRLIVRRGGVCEPAPGVDDGEIFHKLAQVEDAMEAFEKAVPLGEFLRIMEREEWGN